MSLIQAWARRMFVASLVCGVLACAASSCTGGADADADVNVEKEEVSVELYVTVPADTAPDAPVYVAGDLPQLGAWRADGVALRKLDEGQYHAKLSLPRGRQMQYKFTRGSWETVEKGPGGEELHNRTLTLDRDRVERVTVAAWRSADPTTTTRSPRRSTITGDVRVHENFNSKHLVNSRRLLVYLPPGYEKDPAARYPVLYMHDGQNLFDDATSFAGEWRADETAERLIRENKIRPLIIVGIDNAGSDRVDEYTPNSVLGEGGRGALYARFVVEEVKPFIDKTYRTSPRANDTAVAGSSLGGLISLYITRSHPDVFGRCAAVSPSLWWSLGAFLRESQADATWAKGKRIWIDMGTTEDETDPVISQARVNDCIVLADALTRAGLRPERDFAWRRFEGAGHNETAWAARFDQILLYLFGRE